MMFRRALLTATTALTVAASPLASAQAGWFDTPESARDYLTPYAGAYNILDDGGDVYGQAGLEYRFAALGYGVRPTLGFNVDWEGDFYGYGGLNWEIPIIKGKLHFIPNFMVGGYHHGDGGKDLGGAIEFRSGIELSYQFDNAQRLGVAFNHISNASRYNKNPGAEALLLTYSIPVTSIFGK